MANVTVNGAWIDAERFFLTIPDDLVKTLRIVIDASMKGTRSALIANVSGGVLHKVSGKLADSIKASTRAGRTRVSGRAGSRYYIGRLWEDGFQHRTRKGKRTAMAARKWAQPTVDAMAPRIASEIERAIDAEIMKGGF